MLSVMAAYVCDAENWGAKIVPNKKWKGIKALGRQKEKECTRRHIKRSLDMFKSLKIKGDARIQVETEVRAVVFNTIVDYNDAKTRTNVVEAIREVQKVAAQSQEDAARVTSSPSLTNELWLWSMVEGEMLIGIIWLGREGCSNRSIWPPVQNTSLDTIFQQLFFAQLYPCIYSIFSYTYPILSFFIVNIRRLQRNGQIWRRVRRGKRKEDHQTIASKHSES